MSNKGVFLFYSVAYPVIPVTGFVRMLNIAGMTENHRSGLNSSAVSPSHGRLPMI